VTPALSLDRSEIAIGVAHGSSWPEYQVILVNRVTRVTDYFESKIFLGNPDAQWTHS